MYDKAQKEAEEAMEKRVSDDGVAYTYVDFIKFFGAADGAWRWARSPIQLAAALAENGGQASVTATDDKGDTALHNAARCDRAEAIGSLVGARSNLEAKNKRGYTALHLADSGGHDQAISTICRQSRSHPLTSGSQGQLGSERYQGHDAIAVGAVIKERRGHPKPAQIVESSFASGRETTDG